MEALGYQLADDDEEKLRCPRAGKKQERSIPPAAGLGGAGTYPHASLTFFRFSPPSDRIQHAQVRNALSLTTNSPFLHKGLAQVVLDIFS